jgi:hypothetical protein
MTSRSIRTFSTMYSTYLHAGRTGPLRVARGRSQRDAHGAVAGIRLAVRNLAPKPRSTRERFIGNHRKYRCMRRRGSHRSISAPPSGLESLHLARAIVWGAVHMLCSASPSSRYSSHYSSCVNQKIYIY